MPARRPVADAGEMKPPRFLTCESVPVLLLGAGTVFTFVVALVVGWFNVHFQLAGEAVDRGDYEAAMGGYAAAAGVLALAAVGALLLRTSPWVGVTAAVGALALVVMFVASAQAAQSASPSDRWTTWTDGAGGVALFPTAWPVYACLVWGLVARVRNQ